MAIYAGSRMRRASEVADPAMAANLRATVLIVHHDGLDPQQDGSWRLRTRPLEQALGLDVRNWSKFDERATPSAARVPCFSGVLLADGWVLTSLHGRRASAAGTLLREFRFLLGYRDDPAAAVHPQFIAGETLLQAKSLRCGAVDSEGQDWALFELDADPRGLPSPVPLCWASPPPGAPLYLAGYPFGMPLRVSDGGCWLPAAQPLQFLTRLNAFRCQSGAGVFDAISHRLVGWLQAGQRDLGAREGGGAAFEWCEFGAAEGDAAERCTSVQALPADWLARFAGATTPG